MTRRLWSAALPLGVVGAGVLVALAIYVTRPQPQAEPRRVAVPLVRVIEVAPESLQLRVGTHGTVVPRTESDLVPEVAGPVVWTSPALVSGGFFEAGDPLLRIDPRDYEAALERARANLERRRSERSRARKELGRQRELEGREAVSASRLDDAENDARVSAAALREAQATLGQAERDLARTEIRAPFTGRVREKQVDVGQFVSRGQKVARVYAIDYAEVRLPVPDEELAYLDLPLIYRGDPVGGDGPLVELRADFAGSIHTWTGHIVRTEGEIDPQSRMVHVVARVEDPYERLNGRPPLAVGLFVEAEIQGRVVEDVVVLPRAALRDGSRVYLVDETDRLRIREVDLLRVDRERALVRAGLSRGERVCISPLVAPVDGMQVRPVPADAPPGGAS